MARTYTKTNLEILTEYAKENGSENIKIHTIPKTNIWLVLTYYQPNKARLYVLEPQKTTRRLVSDNFTQEDYNAMWSELLKLKIHTIKQAVLEYRKVLNKHNKNKQNEYKQQHTNGLRNTRNSSKNCSKRHSTNTMGS